MEAPSGRGVCWWRCVLVEACAGRGVCWWRRALVEVCADGGMCWQRCVLVEARAGRGVCWVNHRSPAELQTMHRHEWKGIHFLTHSCTEKPLH